ncbi:hypothetical protein D9619_005864 [Psilocybe cf. subviscida]|uniref:Phospholipid scramblase n=1 Tax=Psilocybe cf. subviscida TaxID=2480587 RepID=A0A8H5FC05_9AGAR|nr:hypothetical protein D9619_005864 [Psilocybe cf. subviscida]
MSVNLVLLIAMNLARRSIPYARTYASNTTRNQAFPSIMSRSYAISRFPKKLNRAGRTRAVLKPTISNKVDSRTEPYEGVQPEATGIDGNDGLRRLLFHSNTLVIERQLEMLNVFIGFEQSNKYTISDAAGEHLGYIAEEPKGFLGTITRQAFATHRPFRAVIMDKEGTPVLWEGFPRVRRPFAWINSRMFVQRLKDHSQSPFDPEPVLETFGEVQQIWHLWRRRYDLFLREYLPVDVADDISDVPAQSKNKSTYYQIAKVDAGLLAWNFKVLDEHAEEIASVGRAFRGFGREIFTDTGRYSVNFESSGVQSALPNTPDDVIESLPRPITKELDIDARALLLGLAVNIDFDYFSRHSSATGGGLFHMSHWD